MCVVGVLFFFLIIRIYIYTIALKNIAEIIRIFNHVRVQLRTQHRHVGHWRLKALEWRKLSPVLWGESQKYQASTSPPPSVRRWVRAGGRNRAHVSSHPCRGPSYLHQATLCAHPGQGPCSACTLCEGSGVSSEGEAAIPSEGCLLPRICKGNPRMAAFGSPQQGTVTEHQTQLKKSGASRHVQVTLERIQHLCSSGWKSRKHGERLWLAWCHFTLWHRRVPSLEMPTVPASVAFNCSVQSQGVCSNIPWHFWLRIPHGLGIPGTLVYIPFRWVKNQDLTFCLHVHICKIGWYCFLPTSLIKLHRTASSHMLNALRSSWMKRTRYLKKKKKSLHSRTAF